MKKPALLLALLCACAFCIAADKPANSTSSQTSSAKIARGEYLVNGVGMCVDCHSPHDQKGAVPAGQQLHGSELPFKPTVEMPWATKAPALAGHDERLVIALLTGKTRMRPPMPEYKMTQQDAEAVAAYLKSLPKPPTAPKQ